jgi:phosphotriesterase-related protein
MATVETFNGPVDTAELGQTLMHEHVFVLSDGVRESFPHVFDADAHVAAAIEKLRDLESRGVKTIVDLSVLGNGRDIPLVQRVVGQTKLNVIAATGLYTYDEVPHYFQSRDADVLAEYFVRDVTEGIQGTNVKAAIFKCATDRQGVTDGVEKVLRAVARAHRKTGAPISTHTHARSEQGLAQQKIFAEEGVDPSRVIIGHSGDTEDLDYLTKIMTQGSTIGMDRFGLDMFLTTEKRVGVIAKLCEMGFAEQIVLSHDCSCYIDWFDPAQVAQMAPNWVFTHISDVALPALSEAGVSDEQIDLMMVGNPRRIFERTGGY